MKIFGLYITKAKTFYKERREDADAARDMYERNKTMRWYTSHFVPELEELFFAIQQAKVGSAARGRRRSKRRLFRIWNKVKTRMAAA